MPRPKRPAVKSGVALGQRVKLRIGFIPLTDCAPLLVAQARGFFARHGLKVELQREPSWANIRDKVALGALDAAHMLAPMPLASTLGAGGWKRPQMTALVLNLNGNAVTISRSLWDRLCHLVPDLPANRREGANALRQVINAAASEGMPKLNFATVFNFSSHQIQLRYWLASAGIDPDQDVNLVVVPPPQMAQKLAAGEIDGFCVGEPWNSLAVLQGHAQILITGYEIWNNRIEKVLGVNCDWAAQHAAEHKAMLMAVLEAASWLDRPENHLEAVALLTRPEYLGPEVAEAVRLGLLGLVRYGSSSSPEQVPDFIVYHRYGANFPWKHQGEWYVAQMQRWGFIAPAIDPAPLVESVFRTDLYREAAAALGMPFPLIDRKPEGLHAGPWLLAQSNPPIAMGADQMFDGSCSLSGRQQITGASIQSQSVNPPMRRIGIR